MSSKNIISLDIARSIAAMLVFTSHVRAYLMVDFRELSSNSNGILTKAFYFATSLGHESVMVFFVLSGFLISGSVYNSFEKSKFSWEFYLTNRLTRLYVVYIPALFLTLFWDKLGIFLTSSSYYEGALSSVLPVGPNQPVNHSPIVFIQNILFLQTITSPVFGTNGVVWSLANEFWYYIVFPICMIVTYSLKQKSILRSLLSIALLIIFFAFFPTNIVLSFGIWLLGFLAFILSKNHRTIRILNSAKFRILTLTIFLTCIVFSVISSSVELMSDYFVGIAYMLVLLSFLKIELKNTAFKRAFQFLSNISYTLYLVHVPLVAFSACYFFDNKRFEFGIKSFLIFLLYTVGTIVYAYFIYFLLEKRTQQIRNWILNNKVIYKN